jgi:zinc transporter ZupT
VDALFSFVAVIVLALVHILGARLTFLEAIPRSYWLSIAGGTAVAYVFVHILPDLSQGQESVEESGILGLDFLERHVYFVALFGLALFYGLERWVQTAKRRTIKSPEPDDGVFWVHMGMFAVYNALIGYLVLHRDMPGYSGLSAFSIAMAFHFLTNDHSLREHYEHVYHDRGRWLLAGAVLTGWLAGLLADVGDAVVAVLYAFIAGGVILNVLKEELPAERESRFWPFAAGAIGYAAVLLVAG